MGGRCKLAIELQPVSLLQGDIIVAERYKRMKREAEERERLKVQQKQRKRVCSFLRRHDFQAQPGLFKHSRCVVIFRQDPNATKITRTSCLGFAQYHRPLHKAALDNDMDMVRLLLRFGADPECKDSKGKTVYSCQT